MDDTRIDERLREKWTSSKALDGHPCLPGLAADAAEGSGSPLGWAAAASAGSEALPGEADPPLLIGGLGQEHGVTLEGAKPDFLTITTPTDTATSHLMSVTEVHEKGYGRPGFAKSEQRKCLGGYCWRRWEPTGESNHFGSMYESWEFSGGPSAWAAGHMRLQTVRPSRVDVAFDFGCSPSLTPIIVADHEGVQRHCNARGLQADGIAGQGGVFTRYLGSRNSDLFIRIYRKDLQDAVIAAIVGPMLRIEVVMKDDVARAWWQVWRRDEDEALRAAAAHVLSMSGLRVLPVVGQVPELIVPDTKPTETLLPLFQQYSSHIIAACAAGIDVVEYARLAVDSMSKSSKHRHKVRVDCVSSQDPEDLRSMLTRMLSPQV